MVDTVISGRPLRMVLPIVCLYCVGIAQVLCSFSASAKVHGWARVLGQLLG